MSPIFVFSFWVVLMTAALVFPVSRLIWVVSVRRLQKKLQKTLDEQELAAQKQRAYFIGFFISLVFSSFFNFKYLGLG